MEAKNQISPFFIFFIIHSMQIGVGILDFTKKLVEVSDYQSWIAIICCGVIFHFIIFMIYYILINQNQDIVQIHTNLFGRYIGFILTMFIVIYYILSCMTVLFVYILVIQTWMFPEIHNWVLALALLLTLYYAVMRGFRTLVGFSVISTIVPVFLLLTEFYLLDYATFRSLLPLFNTTVHSQVLAIKEMGFSFIGPEILLICFPFIQMIKKSKKYAYLANIMTTLIYLFIVFFTFVFFAEKQIVKVLFPTLTAWKVVNLPFIERFEYLGIAIWMIAVLPNLSLSVWAATRLLKRQLNIQQKRTLPIIILICFLFSFLFKIREWIQMLAQFVSHYGLLINFVYIPILFIIILIKRKMTR